MGRRGNHPLDGREFLRYKAGHLPQIFSLHHDQQVVATTHQLTGNHLGIASHASRNPVKPTLPLGGNANLDDRTHAAVAGFVRIEDRLVAEDNSIRFEFADRRLDLFFTLSGQTGKFSRGGTPLLFQ